STLAEAEIEYQDVESPSIYVAFKARDTKGKLPDNAEYIICTTTPWTIPSNMAIAVNPNFEYSVVAVADHKFVVATDLVNSLATELGWADYTVEGEPVKGTDLEYMV